MRHRLQLILAIAIVASCVGRVSGALLYYDSFNYPPGAMNLSAAAPVNWIHSGTSGVDEPKVENVGGLNYPNLRTSSDTFSLQYNGRGLPATATGVASHDISATGINSGTLYYSLLMKVPTVHTPADTVPGGAGFSTGANLVGGSFMAGFQTNPATTNPSAVATVISPLLIRSSDQNAATGQFATTYELGTSKTATAADRMFVDGRHFTTGPDAETVFVVLKYTFDPTDPNNDTAQLFINPTPGGPEPAAQLTVTAGASPNLGTPAGVKSFFVRNNSVEPDIMLVDEVRIGTTWADVTPAIPEPSTGTVALLGLCLSLLWRRRIEQGGQ